eukprot:12084985-Prorocentrum_lima.AAC.1
MQMLILAGDVETPPQDPPNLTNSEDEWEWRGGWLIRHYRRPRRRTKQFHPDRRSSELPQSE